MCRWHNSNWADFQQWLICLQSGGVKSCELSGQPVPQFWVKLIIGIRSYTEQGLYSSLHQQESGGACTNLQLTPQQWLFFPKNAEKRLSLRHVIMFVLSLEFYTELTQCRRLSGCSNQAAGHLQRKLPQEMHQHATACLNFSHPTKTFDAYVSSLSDRGINTIYQSIKCPGWTAWAHNHNQLTANLHWGCNVICLLHHVYLSLYFIRLFTLVMGRLFYFYSNLKPSKL